MPYASAPAVEGLQAAGAVLIGRTNSSALALRLCTVNPLHGRTLNPVAAAEVSEAAVGRQAPVGPVAAAR